LKTPLPSKNIPIPLRAVNPLLNKSKAIFDCWSSPKKEKYKSAVITTAVIPQTP